MTQLKYHDGDRFRGAPNFRDIQPPVGNPLFWWPMINGFESDSTGFGQGTIHGAQWRRGSWAGGWGVEGDGSDDYIDTTDWRDTGDLLNGSFSIVFTLSNVSSDTAGAYWTGVQSHADHDTRLYGPVGSFGAPDGHAGFVLRDASGDNEIRGHIDESLNSLGTARIVLVKSGEQIPDDVEMWANATDKTEYSSTSGDSFGEFEHMEETVSFLCRNRGGGGDRRDFLEAVLDNVVVYDRALTEEEIEEDYRRQPWS